MILNMVKKLLCMDSICFECFLIMKLISCMANYVLLESYIALWLKITLTYFLWNETSQDLEVSSTLIWLSISLRAYIKDTWYLWAKNSENMQLLDVLVCTLVNKPYWLKYRCYPWCYNWFSKKSLLQKKIKKKK